ncbi:MAG TPA: hypothetical protein VEC11_14080 [Allosphingosinicella sp.]|nr:hypothetical protein [Allosphingosinicella sp.]
MAHATRGIAATFVASSLALAACGQAGENVRGGGPAKNQGNVAEEPFANVAGPNDTPSRNGADAATRNGPADQEEAGNRQ